MLDVDFRSQNPALADDKASSDDDSSRLQCAHAALTKALDHLDALKLHRIAADVSFAVHRVEEVMAGRDSSR